MDSDKIVQGLKDLLVEKAQHLLEGATADVQIYFAEIARNAGQIATIPPERQAAAIEELKGQAVNLLEINRLRVVNAQHETLNTVIEVAIRDALVGLAAI